MFQLRVYSLVSIGLMVSLGLSKAFAQESEEVSISNVPQGSNEKPAETSRATKKQALDFEDELIEGVSQKPDLLYIFQKNNFKFKKLIKLRENFLPEMNRNAEDIQRLRGGR